MSIPDEDTKGAAELYDSAYHHAGVGRYDLAMAQLEKALQKDPRHAMGHVLMGVCLRVAGQMDRAETSYRKAISLKEDLFAAHYNLGALYYTLGRHRDSAAEYEKAIGLDPGGDDPGHRQTRINLGHCYRDMGKHREAAEMMRSAGCSEHDLLSPTQLAGKYRRTRESITAPADEAHGPKAGRLSAVLGVLGVGVTLLSLVLCLS